MNKQIYRDIALVAIGGALSLVAYKLFSKLTRKHRTKAENDKFQQSNEIIQEVFKIYHYWSWFVHFPIDLQARAIQKACPVRWSY